MLSLLIPVFVLLGFVLAVSVSLLALNPKYNRSVRDLIGLVRSVDLADLDQLVSPATDAYLQHCHDNKSMTPKEFRTALRNRLILILGYFRIMSSNAVVFQEMARTQYDRVQDKSPAQYDDSDRLICEVLERSTQVRVYLAFATIGLLALLYLRIYSRFDLLQAKLIMDQYCAMTEAALAFTRTAGCLPYENLRAAL